MDAIITDTGLCHFLIDTYAGLMRIKACEAGENKELDYQIKVVKEKLELLILTFQNLNRKTNFML